MLTLSRVCYILLVTVYQLPRPWFDATWLYMQLE